MRKRIRHRICRSVVGAAALLFAASAGAADEPEPELRIVARVYNYARVPSPTLTRAESEAGRVFGKGGVRIDWLDCPLVSAEEHPVAVCQQYPSPIEIVLRILPSTIRGKLRLPSTVFGFAVPAEGAGRGFLASVYYDRIEDLARREDVDAALILGPAIAHEIGHLLLPTRQHARSGVLTGEWRKEQVRLAARGQMVFTSEERDLICADVAARTRERGGSLNGPKPPGGSPLQPGYREVPYEESRSHLILQVGPRQPELIRRLPVIAAGK